MRSRRAAPRRTAGSRPGDDVAHGAHSGLMCCCSRSPISSGALASMALSSGCRPSCIRAPRSRWAAPAWSLQSPYAAAIVAMVLVSQRADRNPATAQVAGLAFAPAMAASRCRLSFLATRTLRHRLRRAGHRRCLHVRSVWSPSFAIVPERLPRSDVPGRSWPSSTAPVPSAASSAATSSDGCRVGPVARETAIC